MKQNEKYAIQLQVSIEEEFGYDLAMYDLSEVRRLVAKLQSFLATDVDTDDMQAVDDYSEKELVEAGVR